MQEKFKQLELLVGQAAQRLQKAQQELAAARQKIRTQEDLIARLRENESELKNLREWKRTTVSTLKKLETRIDRELAKAQKQQQPWG